MTPTRRLGKLLRQGGDNDANQPVTPTHDQAVGWHRRSRRQRCQRVLAKNYPTRPITLIVPRCTRVATAILNVVTIPPIMPQPELCPFFPAAITADSTSPVITDETT